MESNYIRLLHHYHHSLLVYNPKRRPATTNRTTTHVLSTEEKFKFFFPPRPIISLKIRRNHSPAATAPNSDYNTEEADIDISKNSDLAPTEVSDRTFGRWEMASLWIGMVVGVPSYYLAGSLVDLGMTWWQGVATVFLANLVLLFPLILTGVPGAKYGISFPVLARSSFGVHGAHVPTLLRALVGCGWYGIESWIGGNAVFLLLPEKLRLHSYLATKVVPWLGTTPLEFLCFLVFWAVQLWIVWTGMDGIRKLEKYSAPILSILTVSLLVWAYTKAGGFGRMLSLPPRLSQSELWSVFFPSLTANISFWASVALNIPDFTRYAKSQRDQVLGQIGLPIFMGLFTFVGLAVTSSTEVIFGRVISDPIHLLGQIGGIPTTILAILGISLATITTNIAANVVAPANALVNLSPSTFTFQRGALLTAMLGIAFQPWRLLKTSERFVTTWLVGYSALLGPIGGIVLADYYLLRGMELDVKELYSSRKEGKYYYSKGFNLVAMVSLLTGILPVIPGFLNNVGILSNTSRVFVRIYNNNWFFGFLVSGLVHWCLSKIASRSSTVISR